MVVRITKVLRCGKVYFPMCMSANSKDEIFNLFSWLLCFLFVSKWHILAYGFNVFFFASLFLCSSLFFFFLFSLYCDRLIATGVKACAISLYCAWITDGLSIFPFHLPSKCRVKERVYSKSFRNNVMSTNARAHSLTKKSGLWHNQQPFYTIYYLTWSWINKIPRLSTFECICCHCTNWMLNW